MALPGEIGVGVCDFTSVVAEVGMNEKSVSANEHCENHYHECRYFLYMQSHFTTEGRAECLMRLAAPFPGANLQRIIFFSRFYGDISGAAW